jgi:hypothetical protein
MLTALAGFGAWFIRVPSPVKLGPAVFLIFAVGTSLLANTENRRFAAPVMPILLMSGIAVLYFIVRSAKS